MARSYLILIVAAGFLLGMEATAPAATGASSGGTKSPTDSRDRDHRFEIKLAKKPAKTRSQRAKKPLPKCVTAEELARRSLIESGVLPRVLQSCR